MNENERTHLGKVFLGIFLLSGAVVFISYLFLGFEVALLVSIVFLCSLLSTAAAGIENTIGEKTEKLHQHLKGYLLDMYAEMIKQK